MTDLNTQTIDISWQPLFQQALATVDKNYLQNLEQSHNWLPGHQNIFKAFSLPLNRVHYILFGESPYPRVSSANGYAFWDAAVHELWSSKGLTSTVNRATSLRNIIKMLLIARGDLTPADTSQPAIAEIDKSNLVQTLDALFKNMLQHGILLLNASLVLSQAKAHKDAQAWQPFIEKLLELLASKENNVTLILLGNIAKMLCKLPVTKKFKQLHAEHPYNISFITNPAIINFFRPLRLLDR